MKLSEIKAKYEPLGWEFNSGDCHVGCWWEFKSPRLKDYTHFGNSMDRESEIYGEKNILKIEIDEEKLLEREAEAFAHQQHFNKVRIGLGHVEKDIMRQITLLAKKNIDIPATLDVSFSIKLK